jgi:hypothetical protein
MSIFCETKMQRSELTTVGSSLESNPCKVRSGRKIFCYPLQTLGNIDVLTTQKKGNDMTDNLM